VRSEIIKTNLECGAGLEEEGEKLHSSSSERPLLVPCNSVRHNILRDGGSRSNRVRVSWKSADVLPRRRACAGMTVSLAQFLHHQAVEGHGLGKGYARHIPCHLRYQHNQNLFAHVFLGFRLSARPKAETKEGRNEESKEGGHAHKNAGRLKGGILRQAKRGTSQSSESIVQQKEMLGREEKRKRGREEEGSRPLGRQTARDIALEYQRGGGV
jgi:hypothetical protein